MIYLGYLAGEFSQTRTQYSYYQEETEKLFRGRLGSIAGTFGTWGPRFTVMLNRWAHGGGKGILTLARYNFLWAITIAVGTISGINFWKWIGYQSIFRRIGEGFGTVLGWAWNLAGAATNIIQYYLTGGTWYQKEAKTNMRDAVRGIPYFSKLQIKNYNKSQLPGLTTEERLKILLGVPLYQNLLDKISKIKKAEKEESSKTKIFGEETFGEETF